MKIDIDELRRRLDEAGIPHDKGWGGAGGTTAVPPFLQRQADAMKAVRQLLVAQIEQDKEKLSELHAALVRAKHGGGI